MRLDQNRAAAQLALKAGTDVTQVSHMTIWGNHSATQVPDFVNAKIGKKAALEVIKDRSWLEGTFTKTVQQRGAAIIAARGKSSAASAASALIDAVKAIYTPTPKGEWFSSAIYSEANPYGIEEDLIFSFPCRSNGKGDCEIVAGVQWDEFLSKKIALTQAELKEERELVRAFVTSQVRS
jgi:malate dehydrogenase